MMKYEKEGETLKDKSKCAELRADLKMCLLESECCKERKHTPKECLQMKSDLVPEQCYVLHNLFFECKRSILDGRRRFRGVKGY